MPKKWSQFTNQETLKSSDQVMLLDTTEALPSDQNKRWTGLKTALDDKLSLTGGTMSGALAVQTINPVGTHTNVGCAQFTSNNIEVFENCTLTVNEIFSLGDGGVTFEDALRLQNDGIHVDAITAFTTNADLLINKNNSGKINIASTIFDISGGFGTIDTNEITANYIHKGTEDHLIFDDPTLFTAEAIFSDPKKDVSAVIETIPYYKEGTWTPTVGDGTNNFTLTTAIGNWTRKENEVTFYCRVVWSSKGSASGTVRISLPFTVRNITSFRVAFYLGKVNGVTFADGIEAATDGNLAYLVLRSLTSGTNDAAIAASGYASTGEIWISGTFLV